LRPYNWARFIAEEDEDLEKEKDANKELTFIQAIFAFVFGRGDPNDTLEARRWQAIGRAFPKCTLRYASGIRQVVLGTNGWIVNWKIHF